MWAGSRVSGADHRAAEGGGRRGLEETESGKGERDRDQTQILVDLIREGRSREGKEGQTGKGRA